MFALVSDAFGGRGGIAQYNRDFFGALAGSGVVCSIFVLPRHAPDQVVTPARIRQRRALGGRLAYAAAAVREALIQPIDVVFCGHLFMAPLGWLIARFKRTKLIVQLHGIEAWQRPSSLCRMAVEAADLVLCVSRHTRTQMLSWAAMPPERVLVLPDMVGAHFTPGDGSALRSAWGLQGKRVLLTVGRMSAHERYKGHDRVIRAIPRLAAAGHDVAYVIVGEGDDCERLQALADREGVADRVRFRGALDTATLVEAYRMADLFVMPSTGEGFGIAFLEAMSCGTPALGLAVGGAVDALDDGPLGTSVTEGEFGSALEQALHRCKPGGAAAAAAVRQRFGGERFQEGVVVALSRLQEVADR